MSDENEAEVAAPAEEEVEVIGGWPMSIGHGEAKRIQKDEHLCDGCFHQGLCVVDAATKQEMLTVISRCGAFVALPER